MPWDDATNTYTPCFTMTDSDVWGFSNTLAEFIAEGLHRLANMKSGYPVFEDYLEHERKCKENPQYGDDCFYRWVGVLRKHRDNFRKVAADDMWQYGNEAEWLETRNWLAENFDCLWD